MKYSKKISNKSRQLKKKSRKEIDRERLDFNEENMRDFIKNGTKVTLLWK